MCCPVKDQDITDAISIQLKIAAHEWLLWIAFSGEKEVISVGFQSSGNVLEHKEQKRQTFEP